MVTVNSSMQKYWNIAKLNHSGGDTGKIETSRGSTGNNPEGQQEIIEGASRRTERRVLPIIFCTQSTNYYSIIRTPVTHNMRSIRSILSYITGVLLVYRILCSVTLSQGGHQQSTRTSELLWSIISFNVHLLPIFTGRKKNSSTAAAGVGMVWWCCEQHLQHWNVLLLLRIRTLLFVGMRCVETSVSVIRDAEATQSDSVKYPCDVWEHGINTLVGFGGRCLSPFSGNTAPPFCEQTTREWSWTCFLQQLKGYALLGHMVEIMQSGGREHWKRGELEQF